MRNLVYIQMLTKIGFFWKKKSNGFKDFDHFFKGRIELPSGDKQDIFIVQDETGKFTIMLLEDY